MWCDVRIGGSVGGMIVTLMTDLSVIPTTDMSDVVIRYHGMCMYVWCDYDTLESIITTICDDELYIR